jgi:aspartate/tyrosine/aromatic aminotransferase
VAGRIHHHHITHLAESSMPSISFAKIPLAPPDSIIGLTEQFKADPNPAKVNLGVGVYLDENGVNPVLKAVKKAEQMWWAEEKSKDYLAIHGDARFGQLTQELVFGAKSPVLAAGRAVTLHSPGGTGALRLAGDFIKTEFPDAQIWISDPTWPNHRGVFAAAGLAVRSYPYYDPATHGLRFEALLDELEQAPEGDAVVLHACCHNPTGVDPTPEQWAALVALFQRRALLPVLDFAYQGLGDGVEEDAAAVRRFAESGLSFLVASSYSKNLGLYRERVGALTLVAATKDEAARVMSRAKLNARVNYSNPPAHGGLVAALVMGDPALRKEWLAELGQMRERILEMRRLFVRTLTELGVARDFSFIAHQRGMFSFSGITKDEVRRLREEFGVYLIENGRINVAGMTRSTMPYLCKAIATVLGTGPAK